MEDIADLIFRSSEPYDPYIPSGSKGGPSAGTMGGTQPGGNKKVSF